MDYKATQNKEWLFGDTDSYVLPAGTALAKNQMGNYMAGYAAGYSDHPTFLYAGVRAGGMWFGRKNTGSGEGWMDLGSIPDIQNGFIDGYLDFIKDHPFRSVTSHYFTGRFLPMLLFDSILGQYSK